MKIILLHFFIIISFFNKIIKCDNAIIFCLIIR